MKFSDLRQAGLATCIALIFMSGTVAPGASFATATNPYGGYGAAGGTADYATLAANGLSAIQQGGTGQIPAVASYLNANSASPSPANQAALQTTLSNLYANNNVNPETAVGLVGGVMSGNVAPGVATSLSGVNGIGSATSVNGLNGVLNNPGVVSSINSLPASQQPGALQSALTAAGGGNVLGQSGGGGIGQITQTLNQNFPMASQMMGGSGGMGNMLGGLMGGGGGGMGNMLGGLAGGGGSNGFGSLFGNQSGGSFGSLFGNQGNSGLFGGNNNAGGGLLGGLLGGGQGGAGGLGGLMGGGQGGAGGLGGLLGGGQGGAGGLGGLLGGGQGGAGGLGGLLGGGQGGAGGIGGLLGGQGGGNSGGLLGGLLGGGQNGGGSFGSLFGNQGNSGLFGNNSGGLGGLLGGGQNGAGGLGGLLGGGQGGAGGLGGLLGGGQGGAGGLGGLLGGGQGGAGGLGGLLGGGQGGAGGLGGLLGGGQGGAGGLGGLAGGATGGSGMAGVGSAIGGAIGGQAGGAIGGIIGGLIGGGSAGGGSGGGAKGCTTGGCCQECGQKIPQHYQEVRDHVTSEFNKHRTWFLTTYWLEHILPALMLMAEQLTVAGIVQIEMIGQLLDAKHQLETQRVLQQLMAEAHKDYQPSEGMCTFGTAAKSLSASERKSNATQMVFSQRMLQRQAMSGNVTSLESSDSDIRSRIAKFQTTFCDPADNARGLANLCPSPGPAARRNIDVDYTRNIESRLTLDLGFADAAGSAGGSGSGSSRPDEEDVFALSANLFAHNIAPRINPEMLATTNNEIRLAAVEKYLDLRAVYAKRSVAQNSFSAITSMRASGDTESAPYTKRLIYELGVTDTNEINQILGERPSYFAQMEVLTKKLYQNPVFYTDLYDKPANVERKAAAMQAIGLMQDRDLYNSLLRSEAVLSVLLETMLEKEQTKVTNEQRTLNASGGSR